MKNTTVDILYNRVRMTLDWTHLNLAFRVRSNCCLASTDSVELFYMLHIKWGLSSREVIWIPRKIFRISYQNSYSIFCSTVLLWLLFSLLKFLLTLKSILYLEFWFVPCTCEMSKNKQNKQIKTPNVGYETLLTQKHKCYREKYKVKTSNPKDSKHLH